MEKQLYNLTIDDEFRDLIPPLTKEEQEGLETKIIQEGFDPETYGALAVWNGTIIDGHNRYEICHRLKIPFAIAPKNFLDREAVTEWIILNQFGRRNLQPFQRVELAEQYRPILEKKAKEKMEEGANQYSPTLVSGEGSKKDKHVGETNSKLAKLAGVGRDSIRKGQKVIESANEAERESLRRGEVTINKVYNDIWRRENPISSQICVKCKEEKLLEEFEAGRTTCKNCRNAAKAHPEEEPSSMLRQEPEPYVFSNQEPPEIAPRLDREAERESIGRIVADLKDDSIDRSTQAADLVIEYEAFAKRMIISLDTYDEEPYNSLYIQLTQQERQKIMAINTAMLKAIERRNLRLKG